MNTRTLEVLVPRRRGKIKDERGSTKPGLRCRTETLAVHG